MDGLPPPAAAASEPRAAAQNRSLTPAEDTRVTASIAARPRSKAVLFAIVVLLVLAITALLVRQKLGPTPRPGAALHLLVAPLTAAAGPTE